MQVASIGLRNAISAGDVRVIHLLLWAGLIEKLDLDTITYTFRLAGGNKLQVVDQILLHGWWHSPEIPHEIEKIKDEAQRGNDQEKLEFIEAVLRYTSYQKNLTFY